MDDSGSSRSARGYEFEQFVLEILKRSSEHEHPVTVGPDSGYDLSATRGGRTVLVDVKVVTPQTSARLQHLIAQLKAAATSYELIHEDTDPELILAFPGVISVRKKEMALASTLTIWDGNELKRQAQLLGIKAPPYLASPEASRWDPESAYSQSLLSELDTISPGPRQWASYENYCEELLNFLFVPPLNTAIPQSRDERNANRRDFILPNYVMDGSFWQFMRSHYEAHYVVAEVKNLSGATGKDEILQVANYLNPRGTGLFSIILARYQMNDTAKWIRREQWVQHNKLIIGLDDEDVRQMLVTKMAAGDPTELIRQKIEEFRLGI